MKEYNTAIDSPISSNLLHNYFNNLVNQFFKILPMRENEEDSLPVYMKGLQNELLGCGAFIVKLNENSLFMTLLSILQYLIDNPTCETSSVRREVFRAISICNKLKELCTKTEAAQ